MDDIRERKVISRVIRRLVPFMIVLYIFNYLDRVNISFAKLEMNRLCGITESVYANGVAIFYIGYCLFEVPSNLVMMRVGARRWIARIMISWGIVSTCMLLIKGPNTFYLLRFLLGVAEAGFFPGIVLYFTYWIPARERARAGAILMTSTAVSGVIGSLLAEQMFRLSGAGGLAGWQWLILVEGIPTVLLGFVVFFFLPDKPQDASWLDDEERELLAQAMKKDHADHDDHSESHDYSKIGSAFSDIKVWQLTIVYCAILTGFYAIQYWSPRIISEVLFPNIPSKELSSLAAAEVSRWVAIPYLSAAIGMVIAGWNSDRTGERTKHVAVCCFIAASGLMLVCAYKSSLVVTIAGLSLSAMGSFGTLGPFWAMPPAFLRGVSAAAGIALINSVGNFCGGLIAPKVMGRLIDEKEPNSYVKGLGLYAGMLVLAGCVALTLKMKGTGKSVVGPAVMPEVEA